MPLQLAHRPQLIDDLFGNASLKASLKSIFARVNDRPSGFLFAGGAGCGKTTLARIVAKAYGCDSKNPNLQSDYIEMNVSEARGIDDARKMQNSIHYAPSNGPIKVYCMDECQGATPDFKDSVLKITEEPPKHVLFIICTTDPDKLVSKSGKKTLERRFHRYDVKPLTDQEMQDFLISSLAREGIVQNYPQIILNEIIKVSEGSPGVAIKLLDQIIDMEDQSQILEIIYRDVMNQASVIDLCRSLLDKNWNGVVRQLRAMPEKVEAEPVRRAILKYMRKVLLGDRPSPQAAQVIMTFEQPWFDGGLDGLVARCWMVMR